MLVGLTPWDPKVQMFDGKIKLDDLIITFHRTVRVPDNVQANDLPPSLGLFPLYKVEQYAAKLPTAMAQKGGAFFPMYQREAMWINFDSIKTYAIKIYTGNTNAISGEPLIETEATARRRINLLKHGKSIQDFVVAPKQKWLDGAAVAPGRIRQFTAMPMGSGYSVEAQLTGKETCGGLRFEVTRLDKPLENAMQIIVRGFSKKLYAVRVEQNATVDGLMDEIRVNLQEGTYLSKYHLQHNSTVTPMLRAHGGGEESVPLTEEMVLAPGGLIKQKVAELTQGEYKRTVSVELNIQILNSASFQSITGHRPPATPISAATYVENGFPFYALYEEPTTISGPSFGIKSIGQVDNTVESSLQDVTVLDVETRNPLSQWSCPRCQLINGGGFQSCDNCGERRRDDETSTVTAKMGLLNLNADLSPLKLSWDLADEAEEAYWK